MVLHSYKVFDMYFVLLTPLAFFNMLLSVFINVLTSRQELPSCL